VLAASAALAIAAGPAWAQERSAAHQKTLVALAQALGESHALRQACEGPGDLYWRSRMTRMVDTEAGDIAFEERLSEAFNAAFNRTRGAFPACSPASRNAEAEAAARGQALALALSQVTNRIGVHDPSAAPPPEPMAEEPTPR
jgi:uncharacterized protein (TIGR02301 family)